MKQSSYFCNSCGDKKDGDDLIGVCFTGGQLDIFTPNAPLEIKKHLCVICINKIFRPWNLKFDPDGPVSKAII